MQSCEQLDLLVGMLEQTGCLICLCHGFIVFYHLIAFISFAYIQALNLNKNNNNNKPIYFFLSSLVFYQIFIGFSYLDTFLDFRFFSILEQSIFSFPIHMCIVALAVYSYWKKWKVYSMWGMNALKN